MIQVDVVYKGLFLDQFSMSTLKTIEGAMRLPYRIHDMHITFELRPTEPFPLELMDREFTCLALGYGNDGNNGAVIVQVPSELEPYHIQSDIAHVTTSLSPGASAKNSKGLQFQAFDYPIAITGKLGYYLTTKQITQEWLYKTN